MSPPMTTPSTKEALEHARSRFACLAEDFAASGRNVDRAMCEVDAERMEQALATLSQPTADQREIVARTAFEIDWEREWSTSQNYEREHYLKSADRILAALDGGR